MWIGEADSLSITVVIDNYVDSLLAEKPNLKRWGLPQTVLSLEQPVAEHGLSLLIEVYAGQQSKRMLMDCGFTPVGVPHNLRLLKVDVNSLDAFFLSHGHRDHYAALTRVLEAREEPLTVITHPDAFQTRFFMLPSGVTLGPWKLEEADVEGAGGRILKVREPQVLAPGLATTGEVERVTDFERPMAIARTLKNGSLVQDLILDDQALLVKLSGKGLVVISGCAHAGIINTCKHSLKIGDASKLYAVIGGFHLSGAKEEVVTRTVKELKALNPELIVPMHCTGFEAVKRLSEELPHAFTLSSVGTRINFT